MAGEMEAYSDALAQFKNVKSEIATIADFIINFGTQLKKPGWKCLIIRQNNLRKTQHG